MIVADRSSMSSLGFLMGLFLVVPGRPGTSMDQARADEPPPAKAAVLPPQLLRPGDPDAHGITDAGLESLRSILRKAVEDRVVPGVSLLLAHQGEVIFKEAFGNLTLDQKAQMASSSKPVTATLLMILVDQGKLSLDDPIEKYLPEFKGITHQGQTARASCRPCDTCSATCRDLPGDFLTESLLKRLRRARGKARRRRGREGGRRGHEEKPGLALLGTEPVAGRVGPRPGQGWPRDRAGGRVPLLHDGI